MNSTHHSGHLRSSSEHMTTIHSGRSAKRPRRQKVAQFLFAGATIASHDFLSLHAKLELESYSSRADIFGRMIILVSDSRLDCLIVGVCCLFINNLAMAGDLLTNSDSLVGKENHRCNNHHRDATSRSRVEQVVESIRKSSFSIYATIKALKKRKIENFNDCACSGAAFKVMAITTS